VFTHGGANMLASVLRGEVADRMAVAINDAFTEMEQAALRDARMMLVKLRLDTLKPIYVKVMMASQEGWSIEELRQRCSYSRPRLEQAVREIIATGHLSKPLRGMQAGLFDA
jgi:hypothetical protein